MNLDALIFVPALVGSTIIGFVFLLCASNYFLTVLEGTAAGAKEIPWQSEAITDHFPKVFYLAWLIGLWCGPAYFVGRALASGADAGWLRLAVPLLVMWALYPVSQLSSLSASSVWVPLTADVFARLSQKPLVTAGFFALSLPVVALLGVAFKWAFMTKGEWHLLFAGSPLLALAALLYARLLGRLAFALMFTKHLFQKKKKKKPKPQVPVATAIEDREPEESRPVTQPSELPPIETPDGELAGYNVLIANDGPSPRKKRVRARAVEDEPGDRPPTAAPPRTPNRTRNWTDEDDDASPYVVNAPEVEYEEPTTRPSEVIKPRADDLALIDRRDAPKPPKVVWSVGLFWFLGQPGTVSALTILSVSCLLAGVLVRMARAFDPTAGAE
ncbi:MAG: hypothetical protein ACKODX_02145 [Gemmata sp.]